MRDAHVCVWFLHVSLCAACTWIFWESLAHTCAREPGRAGICIDECVRVHACTHASACVQATHARVCTAFIAMKTVYVDARVTPEFSNSPRPVQYFTKLSKPWQGSAVKSGGRGIFFLSRGGTPGDLKSRWARRRVLRTVRRRVSI